MYLCGGSFLGKLRKAGLVTGWSDGYYLTEQGKKALS
jgi:hypothetical protein